MKRRLLTILMAISLVSMIAVGCGSNEQEKSDTEDSKQEVQVEEKKEDQKEEKNDEEKEEAGEIILSTTTSTQDSGLLDFLLPKFTEETGIKVKTVAVGTGKALEMGRNGEADVLLVHAKSEEEKFVEEGYGLERKDVMYNDFILLGPKSDPIQIKENHPNDIKGALKEISETATPFVSRGDDSGTNKAELKIWKSAEIEPEGEWYISAGSGMGDVLKMASEKQAYTIADRGTYLSMKDDLDLDIVTEKEDVLYNQYGVIPVNPEKSGVETVNTEGAKAFEEWITSAEVQELISDFGVDKYGQPLFTPNAE
ncbi:MAG: substrate-binding domain-containing protein [Andreesenia angusta]|nr:substrate-binding domain-containing protein [Andreesenia angusta]